MKRFHLFFLVMAIFSMVSMTIGCQAITHFIYPNMTPEQTLAAVQADAASVARARVMWACAKKESEMKGASSAEINGAKDEIVSDIMARIEQVRLASDPMALVNKWLYQEMIRDQADYNKTFALFLVQAAGRRVLQRVGIQQVGSGVDAVFKAVNFDKPMWDAAVDAYEKAILDFKKEQGIGL